VWFQGAVWIDVCPAELDSGGRCIVLQGNTVQLTCIPWPCNIITQSVACFADQFTQITVIKPTRNINAAYNHTYNNVCLYITPVSF